MGRAERFERRQLDDSAHVAFEKDRQDDDVRGHRLPESRVDLDVVLRHIPDDDPLLFQGALADQPFAEDELHRDVAALFVCVTGLEREVRRPTVRADHPIEHAMLGVDHRRELGKDHL